MITVHTDKHRLHDPKSELSGGELVTPFEAPFRVELVLKEITNSGLGPVIEPAAWDLTIARKIHSDDYIEFLSNAWQRWHASGCKGDAIPSCFPTRGMRQRVPVDIDAQLGYYAFSAETSITEGTWAAAYAAMECALSGATQLQSGNDAFALCRPPGHHAARDLFGGYCFLNNAAIAAQKLLDDGAARVAIIDVDFHHGNGTQDIFYARDDVYFLSIHGAPEEDFPYFLGYADELGTDKGKGFTRNYPLPRNTGYQAWAAALSDAIATVRSFHADALVVSLGVDTFENDPISYFKLKSDDYRRYGEKLKGLALPTLFCFEGGYGVPEIGLNVVNVLRGYSA